MKLLFQFTILVSVLFLNYKCSEVPNSKEEKKNGPPIEYAQKVKNKFPAFETFLCTLDSIYDYGLDKEYFYSIAKKPEGYYLEISKYENREKQIKEFIQLWDYKTNSYTKNSLRSYIAYESEPYGFYDRNSMKIQTYDFHLFYGYDDYFDEVIKFYDNKSNPSDEDYEILSRAHDTKSISYIHNGQWGFSSTSLKGNKDPYYSKLSEDRVNGFIKNINLCQKYLELIHKRNPDYKTYLIGDVNLKIANNYVHMYQRLMSIKEETLASKYLQKVKYKKEYIQAAKNYLNACENRSFLFSFGDNDSFPLWYVQEFMNYRKDVHVYNTSLLGVHWYHKMIRERDNLSLKLDVDQANKYKCYTLYTIGSEPNNDIIEVFNQKIMNDDGYVVDSSFRANLFFDYKGKNIRLYDREYMFDLSRLFVIDVIQNYPNRSIYFTSSITPTKGKKTYSNIYEISDSYEYDSIAMRKIEEQLSSIKKAELFGLAKFAWRNKQEAFNNLIAYSITKDLDNKVDLIKSYFDKIDDESLMKNDLFVNYARKYYYLSYFETETINDLLNKSPIWQIMIDRVRSMTFKRNDILNNRNDLEAIQKTFENIDRCLNRVNDEKLENRQFESKEKIFLILDKLIEDEKISKYPKTLIKVKAIHKYLLDAIINKKKENIEKVKMPSSGSSRMS